MHLAWRRVVLGLLLLCAAIGATAAVAAGNYTPTAQEVADVDARTDAYFKAMARADFRRAYAMLAPAMQTMFPLTRWERLGAEANALRGKHFQRRRTAVTWMLDPPDAAGPGLYGILDFQGHSVTVPAQSEYLIWQRAPGETDFRLLRHEQHVGSMRNANGATASTPATAEASAPAAEPAGAPLEEVPHDKTAIGYASVVEARTALASKPGATVTDTPEGWRIVVEGPPPVVWSFTPAGHPAFPSVVRRAAVERDGGMSIDMAVICEADKAACDKLVHEFRALNRMNSEAVE